jgi:hypothetical protein
MPVSVSQPTSRIQESREDERIAVENPRHRAEISGIESSTDIRESDVDDEKVQAGKERRGGYHENGRRRARRR